jgi:hypothetical protein
MIILSEIENVEKVEILRNCVTGNVRRIKVWMK